MRPRISLRLFLILFTLIAVALGGAAHFVYRVKDQVRRHKAAVAKLQEMDCMIYETEHGASVAPSSAFESFARKWIDKDYGDRAGACEVGKLLSADEAVNMASLLTDVQGIYSINLAAEEIGPETVQQFAVHPNLKYLFLHVERIKLSQKWNLDAFAKLEHLYIKGVINDPLAKAIGRIPHLNFFDVDASALSDDGLRALCSGPQLGIISIRRGNITAAPAGAIAASPSIGSLHLTECKLTTDSLERIASASKLKQVIVDNCQLPRQCIEILSECAGLKLLTFADRETFADLDLESLRRLHALEELAISGLTLTGADFQRIDPPESLKTFEYEGDMEEALLQKFFASAPKCEIDQRAPPAQEANFHGKRIHLENGKLICKEYTYADCGVMPP